ncbi:hypothetical protein HK101_002006, partial [Irineochytrium annulatum]
MPPPTPASALPITLAEFSRAMQRINASRDQRYAVAVCGRVESMALASLMRSYAGARNVLAVTVDYSVPGLRPLAGDVDGIGARMKDIGVDHERLKVDWTKPGTTLIGDDSDPPRTTLSNNLTDVLRTRRSNLLAALCDAHGLQTLASADTLDRQVALHLSRSASGSDLAGLAAHRASEGCLFPLARHRAAGTTRLIRPVLGFPRARLRATCEAEGILAAPLGERFSDVAGRRVRLMEERVAGLDVGGGFDDGKGVTLMGLGRLVERLGEHRDELSRQVQDVLDNYTLLDPPTGAAFVNLALSRTPDRRPTPYSDAPPTADAWLRSPTLANRVLQHIVNWCSPVPNPLQLIQADILRQQLITHSLLHPSQRRAVVFRNVIATPPRANHTGRDNWIFTRSPLGDLHRKKYELVMRVGDTALWDGRFYVTLSRPSSTPNDEQTLLGVPLPFIHFTLRPLSPHDYRSLLTRLDALIHRHRSDPSYAQYRRSLVHYMTKMPPDVRATVPCVALRQDGGESSYVVAVPSLGINLERGLVEVGLEFRGQ